MVSRPALSREQSRAVDELAYREFHIPGLILMENAGRGCADLLAAQNPRQVLICCGPGNNGGDGYVIARHLNLSGIPVKVALFCPQDRIRGDALTNFRIIQAAGLPLLDSTSPEHWEPFEQALEKCDWVVDALLGTGVTSAPREPVASAIRRINHAQASVLAVDIPSGLDCNTGQPHDPTIKADLTATFVTPKSGYDRPEAQRFLGAVHVIDIGTPQALLERVFSSRG